MITSEFEKLAEPERKHFERCSLCDEYYDRRDMDQVYYHTFFKHGRAATEGMELSWKRVHGVLPNEELPYSAGLRTLAKLKN